MRKPLELKFVNIVPDLPPEERIRRIERFIDTLAKANGVEGYVGCKCFSEKGDGEVYIS